MGLGEETLGGRVLFSSHPVISEGHTTVDVNLDPFADLPGFSAMKSVSLSVPYPLDGSHHIQLTLKEWGRCIGVWLSRHYNFFFDFFSWGRLQVWVIFWSFYSEGLDGKGVSVLYTRVSVTAPYLCCPLLHPLLPGTKNELLWGWSAPAYLTASQSAPGCGFLCLLPVSSSLKPVFQKFVIENFCL